MIVALQQKPSLRTIVFSALRHRTSFFPLTLDIASIAKSCLQLAVEAALLFFISVLFTVVLNPVATSVVSVPSPSAVPHTGLLEMLCTQLQCWYFSEAFRAGHGKEGQIL